MENRPRTLELTAKRSFSGIGAALTVVGTVTVVLQLLAAALLAGSGALSSSWLMWIVSFVPLYVVAIPIGLLLFKKIPARPIRENRLGAGKFFLFLIMCFPMMYGGNVIGSILSLLLSGGSAQNEILNYALDTNPVKIVVIVALAPVLEEYVFRRQIIDRSAKYGEKLSILFSALVFGLFHMNLYQFFYAFGIGLILGYVYVRTGRIRYTVALHMILNFLGGVATPWLLSALNPDVLTDGTAGMLEMVQMLPGMLAFLAYAAVMFGLAVAGLVLLIVKRGDRTFLPAEEELPEKGRMKAALLNPGVLAYVAVCLGMTVWALFA